MSIYVLNVHDVWKFEQAQWHVGLTWRCRERDVHKKGNPPDWTRVDELILLIKTKCNVWKVMYKLEFTLYICINLSLLYYRYESRTMFTPELHFFLKHFEVQLLYDYVLFSVVASIQDVTCSLVEPCECARLWGSIIDTSLQVDKIRIVSPQRFSPIDLQFASVSWSTRSFAVRMEAVQNRLDSKVWSKDANKSLPKTVYLTTWIPPTPTIRWKLKDTKAEWSDANQPIRKLQTNWIWRGRLAGSRVYLLESFELRCKTWLKRISKTWF